MDSAAQVLAASRGIPLPPSGVISLGGVDRVDLAGVAVLLALKRRAAAEGKSLSFAEVPPNLDSLAALYGVVELLAPGPVARRLRSCDACRRDPRRRAPLRQCAGARRRGSAGRARRILRPAGTERRRQDDADLHPRGTHARRPRDGKRSRPRRHRRLSRRAATARRRAAGAGLRPVLHRARDARDPGRLFRHPRRRCLDRRDARTISTSPRRPMRTCARSRGHEAARAGRPGAGAQAAGHRAGRADRRGGRRAAAEPVGIHPQAQSRRSHDHPHHALPRRGRGALPAHRDAQGGQDRGARHHAEPAVDLRRADGAAHGGFAPGSPGGRAWYGRTIGTYLLSLSDYAELERLLAALRGRASRSRSSRCRRPISSRCSCASWRGRTEEPGAPR